MHNIYPKRKARFVNFFEKRGRLPSYSEMLDLFSLKSKNTVAYTVNKFIEEGLVDKDSQGFLIPKKIVPGVKLLGTVEAGFPSPAEEELIDTITLDQYLISNKDATFILKVSGKSMIGAGINPGDLVLVEKGRSPVNKDIVVAEVDGEWTMKRFEKRGSKVILMPANPNFKPIYPKQSLKIGGVVTAVIRKYH